MKSLEKAELKELLNKCWMTHDGMWFFHCMQECGMETANKMNKAAIRSMGSIEIGRIMKSFGIEKITGANDIENLLDAARQTVVADFMKFNPVFSAENTLHIDMVECFAYKGMQRIGAISQYECGIFERIETWFDTLGIKYAVTPQVTGCTMHTDGKCFRDYTFTFSST